MSISYVPFSQSKANWFVYCYDLLLSYLEKILRDKATRNVFYFLLLNASFTVVEFLYGW
jgi:Co/Zn/Cd efflux system component